MIYEISFFGMPTFLKNPYSKKYLKLMSYYVYAWTIIDPFYNYFIYALLHLTLYAPSYVLDL